MARKAKEAPVESGRARPKVKTPKKEGIFANPGAALALRHTGEAEAQVKLPYLAHAGALAGPVSGPFTFPCGSPAGREKAGFSGWRQGLARSSDSGLGWPWHTSPLERRTMEKESPLDLLLLQIREAELWRQAAEEELNRTPTWRFRERARWRGDLERRVAAKKQAVAFAAEIGGAKRHSDRRSTGI